MTDRKQIIAKIHQIVEEKLLHFQALIDDLRSSNTETKSSMGDKYETSREMLQQEIMQLQRQLAVFQEHRSHIEKLTETSSATIKKGSIIKTTFGNFLIITGLGQFEAQGEKFVSISEQSPLAQQLITKKAGDFFYIQHQTYQILEVR